MCSSNDQPTTGQSRDSSQAAEQSPKHSANGLSSNMGVSPTPNGPPPTTNPPVVTSDVMDSATVPTVYISRTPNGPPPTNDPPVVTSDVMDSATVPTVYISQTPNGPPPTNDPPVVTSDIVDSATVPTVYISRTPNGPPPTSDPPIVTSDVMDSATVATVYTSPTVSSSLGPITDQPPYTDDGTTIWRTLGRIDGQLLLPPELPTSNDTTWTPKASAFTDNSGSEVNRLAAGSDISTCEVTPPVTSTASSSAADCIPTASTTPALLSHLASLQQRGPQDRSTLKSKDPLSGEDQVSIPSPEPTLLTATTSLLIAILLARAASQITFDQVRRFIVLVITINTLLISFTLLISHAAAHPIGRPDLSPRAEHEHETYHAGDKKVIICAIGGAFTVMGLIGLVWCMLRRKAERELAEHEELRNKWETYRARAWRTSEAVEDAKVRGNGGLASGLGEENIGRRKV